MCHKHSLKYFEKELGNDNSQVEETYSRQIELTSHNRFCCIKTSRQMIVQIFLIDHDSDFTCLLTETINL